MLPLATLFGVDRASPYYNEREKSGMFNAESYRLLAFVNLITNTRLDDAVALLERALTLSPGRHEFSYVLAQVHLRRKDYKVARVILEQVIAGNPNPQMRDLAEEMLETVKLREKYQPKQ